MFGRVAILGLGLMGGSLGLALKKRRLAWEIAGYDAAPDVAQRACTRGAVTRACGSIEDAVVGADLVVLAAPVLATRDLLRALAPHLAPGAVVTDLGSTKARVVAWAEETLPAPGRFVGGHPMAGQECSGIAAARATLYSGCVWCLTPTPRTDADALARVSALAAALDASPRLLDPIQHDVAVAAVSHLPLAAATALTLTAADDPAWALGQALAAGGFRDTTRVASGDPRMARDICLTNAAPLADLLDAYIARLAALRDTIRSGDPAAIEATFQAGRDARDGWLAERASSPQDTPGARHSPTEPC